MKSHELKNFVVPKAVHANMQGRAPNTSRIELATNPLLEPIIYKLAIDNPTWRFEVESVMRMSIDDNVATFMAYGFHVFADDEALGSISRVHSHIGYKIQVRNERIMEGRQRGSGYVTESADKAIAKVKKTFGRLSQKERITKAYDRAENLTSNAVVRRKYDIGAHESVIQQIAMQYVMGEGFNTFMRYVEQEMPPHERDRVTKAATKKAEIESEMATLLAVRDRLGKADSALIVRDLEKYIVRVGDTVNLYDDNTLPADMRGKIGMLKLVEREHFVSDIGCRVDDNIFVVLLDGGNNVSEGETK